MKKIIYVNPKLICVPVGYHKYLDVTYDFKISDCYTSNGIEVNSKGDFFHACVSHNGAPHSIFSNKVIIIPESIYFKIVNNNGFLNVFVDKAANPDLYEAAVGFRESKLSNKRVHKYMSLFKAYEALTQRHHRQLEFTAVRHCLSHSNNSLTKSNVLQKLKELFGQTSIDFTNRKQARTFYEVYWKLLIATDDTLYSLVSSKIKTIQRLKSNCAYVK